MSDTSHPRADPPNADGRVLRGARNRERIVEAMLDIIRSGSLRPTAEQVAERAGVGTRTVFRHFDDMDALYAEMSAAIQQEIAPMLCEPLPAGTLADRVRQVVERRAAVFEIIAPFQRAAAVQRWRSTYLQENHAAMTRELRTQLRQVLPELDAQEASVLEAADLLTCWESWRRLRDDQGLGLRAARGAMRAGLAALLGVD